VDGQNCDGALLTARPYRDTSMRSGGSKHHPKPQSTDQSQGMSASCICRHTMSQGGTSAIITVRPRPGGQHTPILTVALSDRPTRTGSLPVQKPCTRPSDARFVSVSTAPEGVASHVGHGEGVLHLNATVPRALPKQIIHLISI
jgi:hypothetical protein